MQNLVSFFKNRLQHPLPLSDLRKEVTDPKVLADMLEEEANIKKKFKNAPPRVCAVMIVFYKDAGQFYLPFMLRPEKSRAHPGQISFPGGKKEKEDKDLIETAIRETHEEIGVIVPTEQVLGTLSSVYIPPSNSLVTPILAYLKEKPSYNPDPDEVDRVLDVRLEDLANPANKTAKKVIMTNGSWFEMPAFAVNDVLIWGGTARMIMEVNLLIAEMEEK